MNKTYTKHLLVRFSDSMFSVGDVIELHQNIIKKNGFVWFGKLGSSIGQNHIEEINKQVKNNIESNFFLVKGNRKISTFYSANIIYLSKDIPENERYAIPPYYFEKELTSNMRFWAKIKDIIKMSTEDVKNLKVIGSVNNIDESLFLSSSGHFFVRKII